MNISSALFFCFLFPTPCFPALAPTWIARLEGPDPIRSHAQKYFLKVQKNGTIAHVPPPRPKRKASHPYPLKAPKNVPSQASMANPSSLNLLAPGYSPWDDTSMLIHTPLGGIMRSQDEYNLHRVEGMLKYL
ncbi:hypothetical protein ACSBR1_013544 [Camellia fascicularis]